MFVDTWSYFTLLHNYKKIVFGYKHPRWTQCLCEMGFHQPTTNQPAVGRRQLTDTLRCARDARDYITRTLTRFSHEVCGQDMLLLAATRSLWSVQAYHTQPCFCAQLLVTGSFIYLTSACNSVQDTYQSGSISHLPRSLKRSVGWVLGSSQTRNTTTSSFSRQRRFSINHNDCFHLPPTSPPTLSIFLTVTRWQTVRQKVCSETWPPCCLLFLHVHPTHLITPLYPHKPPTHLPHRSPPTGTCRRWLKMIFATTRAARCSASVAREKKIIFFFKSLPLIFISRVFCPRHASARPARQKVTESSLTGRAGDASCATALSCARILREPAFTICTLLDRRMGVAVCACVERESGDTRSVMQKPRGYRVERVWKCERGQEMLTSSRCRIFWCCWRMFFK